MIAKLLWEIGASLQMLIGVAHVLGTLYSQLLHPEDKNLIEKMKSTLLNVDKKATQWNAWIFFNLAFGLCLFMVGLFSCVLAYEDLEIIKGFTVLTLGIVVCSMLITFFVQRLAIRKVRTVFVIVTVLYLVSILLNQ